MGEPYENSDNCRNRQSSVEFPESRNGEKKLASSSSEKREELNETLHQSYGFSSIEELARFSFSKKYSFEGLRTYEEQGEPYLYKTEKWNVKLGEFMALKEKLNNIKARLNYYDLNEWHEHTRFTNPAGSLIPTLKRKLKKEFLTQAWCKFHELVSEFNLIPADAVNSQSLYTVHLCEAPGAFVASLHHYLKANYPSMKWHWRANSLNPYYEGNNPTQMINDDRLMVETMENWDFGPDMTGDITHRNYPDYLKSGCEENPPHLITADGSFDCQDKPEEQESSVSWLLLKETLIALRILRKGGHYVMKMFTFFECDTICLLYLLRSVFERIDVMKPVTSKEGNSEVYVVCQEFKGTDALEDHLFSTTLEQHQNFAMFSYNYIQPDFIESVLKCAQQYASYQIKVIERNIKLFDDSDDLRLQRLFKFIQKVFAHEFVEIYKLQPIPFSKGILFKKRPSKRYTIRTEASDFKEGSHADRINKKNLSKEEVLGRIYTELDPLGRYLWAKETLMPEFNVKIEDFNIVYCKPIKRVMSSQFCHVTFVRMMNELIDTISIESYHDFFAQDTTNFEFDCQICDFRSIHSHCENFNDIQLFAFQKILSALSNLKNGDDLVLINFSLLTQFCVNVLCLLKQIFEKIELRNPRVLCLLCINVEERTKWKAKLEEISQQYTKDRGILSFFPLKLINGMNNSLHSWLLDANNVRAYHDILSLTDFNLRNNV